jgi:hypothetical protein
MRPASDRRVLGLAWACRWSSAVRPGGERCDSALRFSRLRRDQASAGRACQAGNGGVVAVATLADILEEHNVVDIDCLDRIYLNAYVPGLMTSGRVLAPPGVRDRLAGARWARTATPFAWR